MSSSVLPILCRWRDLAMSCGVLRSLHPRSPRGLTVVLIVLLATFYTCDAMGPLCRSYRFLNGNKFDKCVPMNYDERSLVRCKDNEVCCKGLQLIKTHVNVTSDCRHPSQCREFEGPSFCWRNKRHVIPWAACGRHCIDDECGLNFQFEFENLCHISAFLLNFTGVASLQPLLDIRNPQGDWIDYTEDRNIIKGVESLIRENPVDIGCTIGVTNEPADNGRTRILVQFMVNSEEISLSEDWIMTMLKRINNKPRSDFTKLIDFDKPVLLEAYDVKKNCPAVDDDSQCVRTQWPLVLAAGKSVRVLCSQERGFNIRKFAERICNDDGSWSDDVDVTRCEKAQGCGPGKSRSKTRSGPDPLLAVMVPIVTLGVIFVLVALAYRLRRTSASHNAENMAGDVEQDQEPQEVNGADKGQGGKSGQRAEENH